MEYFDKLKFEPHQYLPQIKRAEYEFDNFYGVSVITELSAPKEHPTYEVAILLNDELCYTTPITDDVIQHCDPEEVDDIMRQVSELPIEEFND